MNLFLVFILFLLLIVVLLFVSNNKLTQVMQDSLGGNAKTLMFVNFSPADYNSDETVTSLSYATRVKKIVNNAAKVCAM